MRLIAAAALAASLALSAPACGGQSAAESLLYSFGGNNSPGSQLIQAWDGNFYGVSGGYPENCGVIYEITPDGQFNLIYEFPYYKYCGAVYITQGPDGSFYGVTGTGGGYLSGNNPSGDGTVFRLTHSGSYTLLYAFGAPGANDGGTPNAPLVLGSDGYFYGTTYNNGYGSIFRISPAGDFTELVSSLSFQSGSGVIGSILQASDGNYYGVSNSPGEYDTDGTGGALFKMTLSGSGENQTAAISTLYQFCYTNTCLNEPQVPNSGIIEGADGQIYGTSYNGGNASYYSPGVGTVYKVSLSGVLTQLYAFCPNIDNGQYCDTYAPTYGLTQGSDGNYYGTTEAGGQNEQGNVFAISPSGNYTDLYDFKGVTDGTPPTQDGSAPVYSLLPASNGAMVGITQYGGADDTYGDTYCCGTIYSIALSPALAGPVQIHLSSASVPAGSPVTASFAVSNAFSLTMQQCYGFSTFNGATTALGKVPGALANGLYSGSITFTPTAPGTYNYALTCGGVESGFATLTVTGKASSTALQASPDPASVGQSVTLKATVTGSGTTPTGSVTFASGSTLIGTAKLSAGTASYTASTAALPPGTYPVSASYSGDATYSGSVSTASSVTLTAAPTATTLTANPTTVAPPATVTLTATVKRSASGATGTPIGSVTFSSGSVTIGTANLNGSGVATFAASSSGIVAGKYPVTARYNGDSEDAASTSASVTVTVE